jgi:hypothetical protein
MAHGATISCGRTSGLGVTRIKLSENSKMKVSKFVAPPALPKYVCPDSRFRPALPGKTKVVKAGARADERKVAAKKDE